MHLLRTRAGQARRSAFLLAVVGTVSILAGACTTGPAVGPVFPGSGKYVALGSSFASGPNIPGADPNNPLCGRSSSNYAHLVAVRLGLNLVDATCQGATIADLTNQQGLNPPQLAAVTLDTNLVTITIGGNDLGYSTTTLTCLIQANIGLECSVPSEAATTAAAEQMRAQLVDRAGTIRDVAPVAQILLVSYLRVFPDSDPSCPPSNPISAPASAALALMGKVLDDAFQKVASDTGVTLVDSYAPSDHTVCAAPADRWVEGAAPTSPAFYYHPNANGMAAVADLVAAAVI